jgi:hypothetical protein
VQNMWEQKERIFFEGKTSITWLCHAQSLHGQRR